MVAKDHPLSQTDVAKIVNEVIEKRMTTMEWIKVILSMAGIPLLAWVLVTLWDFNEQVTRLSQVAEQVTTRLAETNANAITRVEFDAHNERLNNERMGINVRLNKHDDQIRQLELNQRSSN